MLRPQALKHCSGGGKRGQPPAADPGPRCRSRTACVDFEWSVDQKTHVGDVA
jgi:hypothetical protein